MEQDAQRLRQDWGLSVQGVVDLRATARQRLRPEQTPHGCSLAGTVPTHTGTQRFLHTHTHTSVEREATLLHMLTPMVDVHTHARTCTAARHHQHTYIHGCRPHKQACVTFCCMVPSLRTAVCGAVTGTRPHSLLHSGGMLRQTRMHLCAAFRSFYVKLPFNRDVI